MDRNRRLDLGAGLVLGDQGVRRGSDGDPLLERLCEVGNEPIPRREGLDVRGVDDEFRPLELDARDGDVVRRLRLYLVVNVV